MTSTSTDMYLKKVKQELIKLSTAINQDDLKNIVGKISELLEEHSHVFYETLNRVRILEDNTDFLYNQVSKLQEESNMEEAFILASDLSTFPLVREYFFNKFERCFQYNITEFLDGFNFNDSDIDTWSILCKQLSNGIMYLVAHANSDDLDWLYCFCSAYQIPLLSSNNGHDRIKTNFSISLITDILSALTLWGREAHMCAWIRIQSVCDLSISLTIL
ncbi:unnamed protein product [Rotaria sp. Silwood2]|nr:unnamed protein product [Rotaria sp. Silwood2]